MSHIKVDKKKIISRIKRIRGQSIALEKSVEDENDCIAVLQQVAAIRGAANGLMKVVLESHLREHLGTAKLTRHEREQEVDEVVRVLHSYLK
jgi:DNA-binding FrmR family transcriptional regulator